VRLPQGADLALPYQWQWRIDRWKASLQSLFGGGNKQRRPQLCPSCGSLVGIHATRCHQCGTNLTFSMAAVTRGLSGVFAGPAPVTSALLVANLLMFGVEWLATTAQGGGGGLSILWGMGGEAAYRLGLSSPYPIYIQHQWYRLVTAMFLHGGLIHIGFNMMALMQIGPALEELYGSARYLFLYVVTGIFGFLVSSFPYGLWRGSTSLGASGAILGLIGALLAITTKRGGAYMRDLRSRLISSVALLFALGLFGVGIDNKAHFGGLALGFVLGKIFPDRQPLNPRERQFAHALGWIAGLAIIASFALMILHYRDPLPGQA
jgi:rhomboid protease GluP